MPSARDLYADLAAAGVQALEDGRPVPDDGGYLLDFHSFRGTLATFLANRGVLPLHLKRIMRHRSIETTDRHYTGLRLHDLARELSRAGDLTGVLPKVLTTDAPEGAFRCDPVRVELSGRRAGDEAASVGSCETSRLDAAPCGKAGDGIRTRDILLGRQAPTSITVGKIALSGGSAHESAHLRRGDGDLGALISVLAELPPDAITALLDLARRIRASTSATG